jgi:putative sigma-54 modulation protein
MKATFIGKNITIHENFKDVTLEKLNRLDKYFADDVQATVTMSTEGKGGSNQRVEVTIPIPGSGTILRADKSSASMLDSVDLCVDALVAQVHKYKTKLMRQRRSDESIRFEEIRDLPENERAADEPDIARVKEIDLQPMTPEEAVLQMNLLGHDFFLFLNMEVDGPSVVYRRKEGNYGLLLPEK